MKTKNPSGASVREQKAALLDSFVKTELAKKHAADAAKISKLRALRLAREAELRDVEIPAQQTAQKRTRKRFSSSSGA
jgi:hypothetical protein